MTLKSDDPRKRALPALRIFSLPLIVPVVTLLAFVEPAVP